MSRAAAISNDPVADEVARDVLRDGGTAVAAALGGFFASAGNDPAEPPFALYLGTLLRGLPRHDEGRRPHG